MNAHFLVSCKKSRDCTLLGAPPHYYPGKNNNFE
jgi:hypothetical protein